MKKMPESGREHRSVAITHMPEATTTQNKDIPDVAQRKMKKMTATATMALTTSLILMLQSECVWQRTDVLDDGRSSPSVKPSQYKKGIRCGCRSKFVVTGVHAECFSACADGRGLWSKWETLLINRRPLARWLRLPFAWRCCSAAS